MAKDYKVRAGECVSSIAFEHGLFWETVWNHPKNEALKTKRENPNILLEGDVLHIPDLTLKEETIGTGKSSRFVLKGVPAKLRLQIVEEPEAEASQQSSPPAQTEVSRHSVTEDPETNPTPRKDKPRADVPYILEIDGKQISGATDADGMIECSIPPNAKGGRLILEPDTPNEMIMPLKLGHLDPVSELSGVKQRLANLGFDCGDRNSELTPGLAAALSAFQEKSELTVTGEADQATRDKLLELHGS